MQGLSAQIVVNNNSANTKRMAVDLGTPIDSSRYEMVYVMQIRDPEITDIRTEVRILQIGDSTLRDGGYARFRIDSVLWKIHEPTTTMKDIAMITSGYAKLPGPEHVRLYIHSNGRWRESEMIGFSGFCALDSTATQKWELLDGNKEIAGFNCKKARTHFRGREWIVWYTPDIPYSAGPWKLGGLTGLILRASSGDKECVMEARFLRRSNDIISSHREHYTLVSREEFRKRYQEDNEYPFRTAFWNQNGRHERYDERQFYNPIEKTLD